MYTFVQYFVSYVPHVICSPFFDCLASDSLQFHNKANLRVFDIYVEGSLVVASLDIIRVAPWKTVPYIVTLSNTFVSDGTMTIDFTNEIGDPQINGIEILRASPPKTTPVTTPVITAPPTRVLTKVPVPVPVKAPIPVPNPPFVNSTTPYRINCGSTTPVTMNNVTWNRDEYATSGAPYNTCGNTTNSIYCSSRYFQTEKGTPFQYNIPVPFNNTSYQLRLHFAEYVRSCTNV
jgi:Malectin domain